MKHQRILDLLIVYSNHQIFQSICASSLAIFAEIPWNQSKDPSNAAKVRLAPKVPVAQRLQQCSTSPKRKWFPGLDKQITTYKRHKKYTHPNHPNQTILYSRVQFWAVQGSVLYLYHLIPGLFWDPSKELAKFDWKHIMHWFTCIEGMRAWRVNSPLLFEHNSLEIWSPNTFK